MISASGVPARCPRFHSWASMPFEGAAVAMPVSPSGVAQGLQLGLGVFQGGGALLDQRFKLAIAVLQTVDRVDLAVAAADQVIGNRDAAVRDFPVPVLAPENQHQPRRFPGQDGIGDGQVNMEEGGGDDDVLAQVLRRQVQHLDAQAAGHLREILAGDSRPVLAVLDQEIAAAGVAAEIFAEARRQAVRHARRTSRCTPRTANG